MPTLSFAPLWRICCVRAMFELHMLVWTQLYRYLVISSTLWLHCILHKGTGNCWHGAPLFTTVCLWNSNAGPDIWYHTVSLGGILRQKVTIFDFAVIKHSALSYRKNPARIRKLFINNSVIFWNEITTILTPLTSEGGEWGRWGWLRFSFWRSLITNRQW